MNEKSTVYHMPQWPEHLPKGWELVRTDWLATEYRETIEPASLNRERVFHYSIPVIEKTGDGQYEDPSEIRSKKLILEGGEILVSKLNPRKARVLQSQNHSPITIASGEFIPLRADKDKILPKYLETVFLSEPVRQYLDGIATSATRSHQRVNPQEIRSLRFPKPPLDTQLKIISFLSYHTDRIEVLIEKNQQLLELVEEKRKSTIEKLLKHGETGEYVKLKYVIDSLPGYAFPSDEFSSNPEDIRLLRGINVGVGEVQWDETAYWPSELAEEFRKYRLEPGDIILGLDRPWISNGIRIAQLDESDCPALLVQRVLRIRSKPGILQEYILLNLASERFRQYFEPITTGVSVPHISDKQVGEFEIPLPTESCQESIISQWKSFRQRKHQLADVIERSIDVLQEKRQCLITAAVTGKIDVSDWEPPSEEAEVPV